MKINLRPPHSEKQKLLITYPDNVVFFGGRRYGKTDGNVQRIYRSMSKEPGLYWWVGLSWKSASMKRAWRGVTQLARKIYKVLGEDERYLINRSRYEVIIPGMGEIWFRTADNPPSLAGEGIRGAVIDEFSLMPEIVWTEYLQATLLDYKGWASFVGVPKGNNWGANLWRAALERDGWLQLHATSYENPFLDPAAIDKIKNETPIDIFRQEYLAEIIDDVGAVFRIPEGTLVAPRDTKPQEHRGHSISFGVDWGKENDFTVISGVCSKCKRQVFLDRFNQIDYTFQTERLKAHIDRWKPERVNAERNSMGEPLVEQLYRAGMPIIGGPDGKLGFNTSAITKIPLIEDLALTIEQGELQLFDDPIQTNELLAYERTTNKAGKPSYNAPEGMHDDTVMALALAWNACVRGGIVLA